MQKENLASNQDNLHSSPYYELGVYTVYSSGDRYDYNANNKSGGVRLKFLS